jgi:hypothetical protein
VQKAYERPATLSSHDLAALAAAVGGGALDYVLVLASFHFINRIADLLHVDAEVLPEPFRRLEPVRRFAVRMASLVMRRMDLAIRPYPKSYEEAVGDITPAFTHALGHPPGDDLAPLAARPKLIEALQLALEERDQRSSLDRATLARIHHTVEAALPVTRADAEGFHPRPADPVQAFAFVGTRYAYRTTEDMIAALRSAGYDDVGILDLAIAIADANQWARLHRLAGLRPELFYVGQAPARAASVPAG